MSGGHELQSGESLLCVELNSRGMPPLGAEARGVGHQGSTAIQDQPIAPDVIRTHDILSGKRVIRRHHRDGFS